MVIAAFGKMPAEPPVTPLRNTADARAACAGAEIPFCETADGLIPKAARAPTHLTQGLAPALDGRRGVTRTAVSRRAGARRDRAFHSLIRASNSLIRCTDFPVNNSGFPVSIPCSSGGGATGDAANPTPWQAFRLSIPCRATVGFVFVWLLPAGSPPLARNRLFRWERATPMTLILWITDPMSAIGVARSQP